MSDRIQDFDLSSLKIQRGGQEEGKGGKNRWAMAALGIIIAAAAAAGFLLRGPKGKPVELALAEITSPGGGAPGSGLTATGYIVPQRRASVASKATGRLVSLSVEEGDKVKEGEIIARIEDQDVQASLEQAKAQLELSKVDQTDAERSLKRARRLLDSNAISQSDFETAETRRDRASAQVKSAEAGVSATVVAYENTRIRAPFDGTVLTKDADVGEVVAPFASSVSSKGSVVTLADMKSLVLEAEVSESNIDRVRVGQPCEIILDAYPDKRYRGVADKIVPTVNRSKATILTKVRFLKLDHRVLPDMSAKAVFLTEAAAPGEAPEAPRLTVPKASAVTVNGKPTIFAVRGGRAEARAVETGATRGDRIEIRSGLSPGDTVVLNPPADLSTGDLVRTKKE